MNQQEMHDEQIKDKLRMKDNALKMAIIDLEVCSSLMTTCEYSDDFYQSIQNTIDDCKEALEA